MVWCEKDKWELFTHEQKINCVREECFVIAIERYLMWRKNYPAKFAFMEALYRVCTTLTSNWFRDFAIENWPEIHNHDYDFVGKFKAAGMEFEVDRSK